jgi:hypothetical protein
MKQQIINLLSFARGIILATINTDLLEQQDSFYLKEKPVCQMAASSLRR